MALRLVVQREVIEQISDIDVELVADRYDPGETHRALRRPIHHARGDRAGLRDQRQVSPARHVRGETRIEICTGHHDAKAIGPDQPHSVFLRSLFGCLRERARTMAEPSADNHRTRRAATAGLIDQAGNRFRRRRNHHQFRHKRQFGQAADRGNAVDLGIAQIDQCEFAVEFRLADIVENSPADRALARTGANQRNRTGGQQIFQTIG